ncbi:hypothetical protein GOB57_08620 [Sinorhizobium meliloti]|nr:hypothetical protein [Sinorhizobium meliloti]
MTAQQQIVATPAHGLDTDFSALGTEFQMPGLGMLGELMDSLSGPPNDNTPVKVAKLDNVPSYQPAPVPGMRM